MCNKYDKNINWTDSCKNKIDHKAHNFDSPFNLFIFHYYSHKPYEKNMFVFRCSQVARFKIKLAKVSAISTKV